MSTIAGLMLIIIVAAAAGALILVANSDTDQPFTSFNFTLLKWSTIENAIRSIVPGGEGDVLMQGPVTVQGTYEFGGYGSRDYSIFYVNQRHLTSLPENFGTIRLSNIDVSSSNDMDKFGINFDTAPYAFNTQRFQQCVLGIKGSATISIVNLRVENSVGELYADSSKASADIVQVLDHSKPAYEIDATDPLCAQNK